MDIMIDLRDLAWKDNNSGEMVRIVEFSHREELHVVWYMNTETLDEHCMDIDAFVDKHTACGLFDDLEPA
jgi:hypothetical protein